jgi:hypothetical protein
MTTLNIGIKLNVIKNRKKFLRALRSGKYTKGVAASDKKTGKPIVEIEGYCACAVMVHECGGSGMNYKDAREALGISAKDCTYIQTKLNDTKLTFPQIADKIEQQIFGSSAKTL